MSNQDHWNHIYTTRSSRDVSWYAPHLGRSLEFIAHAAAGTDAAIIDIGAGASTLADDLLDRGYRRLSLLDISEAALAVARTRLAADGDHLHWLVGDITTVSLPAQAYDVWHDRAAFHFLREAQQREAYVDQLRRALRPGGQAVIATFADDGPERCSGLPVVRYGPEALAAVLGPAFVLEETAFEDHHVPSGAVQKFLYCRFRYDGWAAA